MTDHRTHGHWVQSKHTIVCAMPDPPPYAITFCSNFAGLALNNEKDDCVESVRQNGRVFFQLRNRILNVIHKNPSLSHCGYYHKSSSKQSNNAWVDGYLR